MHDLNGAPSILSAEFAAINIALRETAREFDLTPWGVRVLLAVDELGDRADTKSLSLITTGQEDDSQTRRPMPSLFRRKLLLGVAIDFGQRRSGIRTRLSLTTAGANVVRDFRGRLERIREHLAASIEADAERSTA